MRARFAALTAALMLVAAACGAGDSPATEDPSSSTAADSASQLTPIPASAETSASSSAPAVTPQPATAQATTAASPSPAAVGSSGTLKVFLAGDGVEQPVTSGRFEAVFSIVPGPGAEFDEPVAMVIGGAYDTETQSAEMTMDLSGLTAMAPADDLSMEMFGSFFAEPLRVITIGQRSWIKWGFFSEFLGAGDKWIEGDSESSADLTGGFGFDSGAATPGDFLGILEDANVQIEEIGTEEVRGVTTTRYRALLDLRELSEQMTAEERADLEEAIGQGAPSELPMDLWIGEDGVLRRLSMEIDSEGFATDGEGVVFVTLTFEMWDYGEAVEIVPPDPADVISGDELGFGFGLDG